MPDTAEHIVKSYEQELKRLRDLVTEMGGMVERQVALACTAVLTRDTTAANQAMEADPRVDAMERDIEQYIIRLLALRPHPEGGHFAELFRAPLTVTSTVLA